MTDATAPLFALLGAGWALLGLVALAGAATLGLVRPPEWTSLDRRPSSPTIKTTAAGRRGPGTPPAPAAPTTKEATR